MKLEAKTRLFASDLQQRVLTFFKACRVSSAVLHQIAAYGEVIKGGWECVLNDPSLFDTLVDLVSKGLKMHPKMQTGSATWVFQGTTLEITGDHAVTAINFWPPNVPSAPLGGEHHALVAKVEAVRAQVLKALKLQPKDLHGKCADVTCVIWKKLGSPSDLVPTTCFYGEEEHVLLASRARSLLIDPTSEQYDLPRVDTIPSVNYKALKPLTRRDIQNVFDESKILRTL